MTFDLKKVNIIDGKYSIRGTNLTFYVALFFELAHSQSFQV